MNMNEQGKIQQNMISNLPLLFANGYPTSLEKITQSQLENFIPFMVQCSLGHINLPRKRDCSEPEWWPEDLPFSIPLTKPKHIIGNWMEKLKEIVIICYQFHKSLFLLRFCNDLASYEQASLRFINNYNSTTSLYDRRSNKLLVTFRNENMSYDQQQRTRKSLLQQKIKCGSKNKHDIQDMMVEPAPFDIYLCDNCDAELYSKAAIMEHEKTCNIEDVILCDSPEPDINAQTTNANDELRITFLLNFNLQCKSSSNSKVIKSITSSCNEESSSNISTRNKRFSRRNRTAHSLARCPAVPLSSPAGQQLLRSTKTALTQDYLTERLERIERFCHTSLVFKSTFKSKILDKRSIANNFQCTFKKPQEYSSHIYLFPRRQFWQKGQSTKNFLFLNSPLIKQCRPIAVRLKKITENLLTMQQNASNANLNIRLTRDASHNSNWRISPSSEDIVDTIDLCSSDEEDILHRNCSTKSITEMEKSRIPGISSNRLHLNLSNSYVKITRTPHKKIFTNECASESSNLTEKSNTYTSYINDDNKFLQPLRPSFYIYSNYKTNSTLNNYNNTLPSCTVTSEVNNQENCSRISPARNVLISDWLGETTNVKKNNVKQNHDLNYENLSILQAFNNSTSRIISIDLTT